MFHADHMHQLDDGEHAAGGPEGFEVEHRLDHLSDGAKLLFDDVDKVFNLVR